MAGDTHNLLGAKRWMRTKVWIGTKGWMGLKVGKDKNGRGIKGVWGTKSVCSD